MPSTGMGTVEWEVHFTQGSSLAIETLNVIMQSSGCIHYHLKSSPTRSMRHLPPPPPGTVHSPVGLQQHNHMMQKGMHRPTLAYLPMGPTPQSFEIISTSFGGWQITASPCRIVRRPQGDKRQQ